MYRGTDWSKLLSNSEDVSRLRDFAYGALSGKKLRQLYAFTDRAGDIRQLVGLGVDAARRNTRRALSRRGLSV